MNPEIVAVVGLVVIFAISMSRGINMGAVGLVAAFVLGVTYYDLEVDEIVGGFPGNLFVTLVGVTFLFGIARANGTVDLMVSGAVAMVRGRTALIPWVFFGLAAIITGVGAVSAATNAILVPVALAFAYRYRINPLLLGLSVLNGTNAGGFSPISVYFSIVDGVLKQNDIVVSPGPVFALTFVTNLLLNVVAFWLLGGRELVRRGRECTDERPETGGGVSTATRVDTRWGVMQLLTIGSVVALVVLALTLSLDVGFMALTAAVVLGAIRPQDSSDAMAHIGWNTVLLIGGMVTYIGMLQTAGVIEDLAQTVSTISVPLVAALTILFIAGVVSAFASTNAMFVVLVPLAAPLLLGGELGMLGFVVALCVAASAVDSSPFSTGGALVIANGEEQDRDRLFRGLMFWGAAMIVVAPLFAWLAFVVLWP